MSGSDLAPARRRLLLAGVLTLVISVLLWSWVSLHDEQVGGGAVRIDLVQSMAAGIRYPQQAAPADGPWRETALPDNWSGRRPAYEGYVWYRFTLPAGMAALARPALYLPVINMNAEVWIDGQRFAADGRVEPPVTRHFYTPWLLELPRALLRQDGTPSQVDVLLVGHPGFRCGLAPPWVGDHDTLYPSWRWRHFWQRTGTEITIVLSIAMGVYALLVWWRERSHAAFAWFGVAVIVWGLRNLNLTVMDPPMPDLLWAEVCVAGAAWFTALFAVFAQRFAEFEDPDYRGPRLVPPLALAYGSVATLYFVSADTYAEANAGFAPLAFLGVGFTFWTVWRLLRLAWRQPRTELAVVAMGATMYLVLLINDFAIADDKQRLGQIYIRQYASLPLFMAITATLARRYFEALRRANRLAQSLRGEVEAQREQLARSFEALREAERGLARDQERKRVMGELHDGLGLHLVSALRQARSPEVPREAVISSLQDCMDDLRLAIDSLDTAERDPVALLGSLRFRLAPRFATLGLSLNWRVADDLAAGELPDAQASLDLLRVAQEALNNALKHSGATAVTMSLEQQGEALVFEVADDGCGFDPGTVRRGRGMGQLHSRAARLGGTLTWRAREGGGTVLRLSLPRPGPGSPVGDMGR